MYPMPARALTTSPAQRPEEIGHKSNEARQFNVV